MIRAVFFDLDDTLCNGSDAFREALAKMYTSIAARVPGMSEGDVRAAWDAVHVPLFAALATASMTTAEVRARRIPALLHALGIHDDRLAGALDQELGQSALRRVRLYDDVSVLGELEASGYITGIITNGADDDHPDSQRSKVLRLGLLDRVHYHVVSDTVEVRKPDPRIFEHAVSQAGVLADDAVYVGDSLANDIAGAQAAGLHAILIARGAPDTRDAALSSGCVNPDAVVTDLRELSAVLARWNRLG